MGNSGDGPPANRRTSHAKKEQTDDNCDEQNRPEQEIPFPVLPLVTFH